MALFSTALKEWNEFYRKYRKMYNKMRSNLSSTNVEISVKGMNFVIEDVV